MDDPRYSELTSQPPRFAQDVSLFLLDDCGVIFKESTQEIYQLNTTATFIWCQLEEGLIPAEIAKALSETFSFQLQDAERHVRDSLENWQIRGFFGPKLGSAMRIDDGATEPAPAASDWSLVVGLEGSLVRHYRILDRGIDISFENPEIESWVHPVIAHLEASPMPQDDKTPHIRLALDSDGYVIAADSEVIYRCTTLKEIAPVVVGQVFQILISNARESLAFHAGAVSNGREALILPAIGGSGKTTLTASLVHDGLTYLSDDCVLLDLPKLTVRGVPFSLCVKEAGIEILRDRFPVLTRLRTHLRPDGKRVRYLSLPTGHGDPSFTPGVGWVVFPSYDPEGRNQLEQVAPSQALVRLTRNCGLLRAVTSQQVQSLIALLGQIPCFQITISNLGQATGAIRGLIDRNKSNGG